MKYCKVLPLGLFGTCDGARTHFNILLHFLPAFFELPSAFCHRISSATQLQTTKVGNIITFITRVNRSKSSPLQKKKHQKVFRFRNMVDLLYMSFSYSYFACHLLALFGIFLESLQDFIFQ